MSSSTTTTTSPPNLKLFFLQSSRAIRIAWLLEELSLPYTNIFFERTAAFRAPQNMSTDSKSSLGKSPVLHDGELILTESGAITEHIIQTYAPNHSISGGGTLPHTHAREQIRTFIHAAEGKIMVHALAISFARMFATTATTADDSSVVLANIERGVLPMIWADLDWLDDVLVDDDSGEKMKEGRKEGGRYLVGYELTAADTMMLFGVQLIFRRGVCGGRAIGEWRNVEAWVERCEGREGWKRTVEKTGWVF